MSSPERRLEEVLAKCKASPGETLEKTLDFFLSEFNIILMRKDESEELCSFKGKLDLSGSSQEECERPGEFLRRSLKMIYNESGEKGLLDLLKGLVGRCKVDELSTVNESTPWLKDVIRLRKVMKILLVMQQDGQIDVKAGKLVIEALQSMENQDLKYLLALAVSFDVKETSILEDFAGNERFKELMRRHVVMVAVVFAAEFLELDKEAVDTFSTNIAKRNQRMKASGYDAEFLEWAKEIIPNPLGFLKFMEKHQAEPVQEEPMFRLYLSKRHPWKNSEAVRYVSMLMDVVVWDGFIFYQYVRLLAEIIRRLANYVSLNHGFLANEYLYMCFKGETDANMFKAAYEIMASSSLLSDVSEDHIKQWVAQIQIFLKKGTCLDVAFKSAEFCIAKLPPHGFELAKQFIDAVKKSTDDVLSHMHPLISIYSYYLNKPTGDDPHQAILEIVADVVEKSPRNAEVFDTLATLLMIEVNCDSVAHVSDKLWAIWKRFLEKKDEDQPSDVLRMFAMFPQLYHTIQPKCPEFYSTMLPSLMEILKRPETSPLLFQVIIETVVDTCLRIPNGPATFEEIRKELSQYHSSTSKQMNCVRWAYEEFLSMYNHPVHEYASTEHADVYVLTRKTALHKLIGMDTERPHISTKTKTGCWDYSISVPKPEPEQAPERKPFVPRQEVPLEPSESAKQFASVIDRAFQEGILSECKPEDFRVEAPKSESLSEVHGSQSCNTLDDATPPGDDEAGESLLYRSYEVSALFSVLFGDEVSANTMFIRKPFPLLDVAACNLFGTSVRECCKVGLLYVKRGQFEQNSILQNTVTDISEPFKSFLASIGVIVDLAVHEGFAGKLDTKSFSNGRYQLYYANDRFEILYHVAPFLTTSPGDEQQVYKKRHVGNDNVHVVWSEHDFDYEASTITSQFNDAHVIVYPLPKTSEFFRVVTYRKSPDYHFGPLREELVLHAKAIPMLVTWTVIFSDRMARSSPIVRLPNELFLDAIEDIYTNKLDNKERM